MEIDTKFTSQPADTKDTKNNPEGSTINEAEWPLKVDLKYLTKIPRKLIRVEYPGDVKNLDKALTTMGELGSLERAVVDNKNKLELRFHPDSPYNKPCTADKDSNPGLLVKITCDGPATSYEVLGSTEVNFTFSRACDFQYLPLLPEETENENSESKCNYIFDQILPDKLSQLKDFSSEDNKNMQAFMLPVVFSRTEWTHNKLYLNTGEKFGTLRPEMQRFLDNSSSQPRAKLNVVSTRQIIKFVDFQKENQEAPEEPLGFCLEVIKERGWTEKYNLLQKLFKERPIYTKNAIKYQTNLSNEQLKYTLPAVAYFCAKGPWRLAWIRFGYNPQKDFNSRIFQILDYRIRTAEGTKLKVNTKSGQTRNDFYSEERSYILRLNTVPPARQMFYHYCDILIPEIQEMLARLPKVPTGIKFNGKTGWLPQNFTEHCREVVNKCVLQSVQSQFLLENTKDEDFAHCSRSLTGVKRSFAQLKLGAADSTVEDTIDLSDGEINTEEGNEEDSWPEGIMDSDKDLSEDEMEFDLEAVQEINEMISGDK